MWVFGVDSHINVILLLLNISPNDAGMLRIPQGNYENLGWSSQSCKYFRAELYN